MADDAKLETPKPLKRKVERETPAAASIRQRLIDMIDRPLIAKNIHELQALATATVGFLQATGKGADGLPKTRRGLGGMLPGGLGGYYAGVPTPFGVVPLSDMRDMFGSRFDPGVPPTILASLQALVRKTRFGAAGLVWRLTAGRPEEREPAFASEIRAKLREMLAEPLTTSRAVAFSRVVDAVVPLVQIGGAIKAAGQSKYGGWVEGASVAPNPPMPVSIGSLEQEDFDTAFSEVLETMTEDDGFVTMPSYAPASPQENFGAKAMREILAALPGLMGARTRSPTELVRAIVEAERAGMPKLATKLREQLGVRDAAEGEKPALDFKSDSDKDATDETAMAAGIGAFLAAAPGMAPSVLPAIAAAVTDAVTDDDKCGRCDGRGELPQDNPPGTDLGIEWVKCDECDGEGIKKAETAVAGAQ